MKKEEKDQFIADLTEQLNNTNYLYLTDISDLNVENTGKLRRLCFKRSVRLQVVKNTLLRKAMERADRDFEGLYGALKGATSIMIAEQGNLPAKLIREFRKTSPKPLLKGAYIEEMCYVGDDQLDNLINIKSKNELIADLVFLLQSPARNVISALQSGGHTLSGVLKTLSEKPE
ncbi:MAG TPA: 50S ribosomal protein L10 [Bacteroidales bacterium]|nr:50S ribosomal protein L10 [Bacteroidales bacterium]HSA43855.1 50S ribosomal protein L10 [Bacteroidales bacterium]